MDNGDKTAVEKLRDSGNWAQWQFVIKTLLDVNGALGVCDGTVQKPKPLEENASANQTASYKKKLEEWEKGDRIARKLFVTTVEQKPLQFLMSANTAKEMWDKLHSVYDLQSDESLALVQKQFFDFKWDESLSVGEHIAKLEQLTNRMKKLKGSIPDSMLLTRILSILPKEYKHFHSAWDSTDETKRTLDNLTTRLLTEEQRLKNQHAADDVEETVALFSRTRLRSSKEKTNKHKKKDQGCFTCGRKDHMRKDCSGCYSCGSKYHLKKNCPKKQNRQGESSNGRNEATAFLGNFVDKTDEDTWIIDSGTSDHMTNNVTLFKDYEAFKDVQKVNLGNGQSVKAYGKGTIQIECSVNGRWLPGNMQDVLYTPEMVCNLFSVKMAVKKNMTFTIRRNGRECFFEKDGKIVATGKEADNLFKMNLRVVKPKVTVACAANAIKEEKEEMALQLWHERLAHQNKRHVQKILKRSGIEVSVKNDFCDGCAFGKMHRKPFGVRRDKAKSVREIIHSDVCGPMHIESIGKKRFFVEFKDDYSGFRSVHFMQHKSEVKEKFEQFVNEVQNKFKENIKELNSDGGREFDNKEMKELTKRMGIKHTVTPPYTPQHNGVSERENRTLVEAARSMLYSKPNLPLTLWAEAINTAAYVLNRTGPSQIPGKTPYELWFHEDKCEMKHLRTFGTECFVHVPKELRRKLEKKAVRGYFVGYHVGIGGYRVYIPEKNDVIVSRDVIFKEEQSSSSCAVIKADNDIDESSTMKKTDTVFPDCPPEIEDVLGNDETTRDESSDFYTTPEEDPDYEIGSNSSSDSDAESGRDESVDENRMKLRDRSKIRKPVFFDHYSLLSTCEEVPKNYQEAISCTTANNWKIAMEDEMNSLKENDTWTLIDKPADGKILDNKWVYKVKNDGANVKYKARLVIRGFLQESGIDFGETFSPVARFDTIRTMISYAARENLSIQQFDVKTAFLHGTLEGENETYMSQPCGFSDGTDRVCKLNKSLYGLKQSSRCWNRRFTSFLLTFGLIESKSDPCLFVNVKNGRKLFVVIYVDDGLVIATDKKDSDSFLSALKREFKASTDSTVTTFLGIEFTFLENGSIFINQSTYISRILKRFNMIDCKPVSTPMDVGWDNSAELSELAENIPYREAVGNLIFLQGATRPDITFAVNVLSRVLDKPSLAHWALVKRVLRYLQGTKDFGILYDGNGDMSVFSDADYAGDKKDRKSTSGTVCIFGGGPVIWRSRKQQSVALSTMEAEYVSAASATKDGIWLSRILRDLGVDNRSVRLYVDNQSAIRVIKNCELHDKSKHIEIKFHFVRDLYKKKEIEIYYVPTDQQLADIFTKALPKQRFVKIRFLLNLCSL